MTDWRKAQGSQEEQPKEFDTTTSSAVVYQRRNVERVTVENTDGTKTEMWQYEEREMTRDEYTALRLEQNAATIDYLNMATDADLSFDKIKDYYDKGFWTEDMVKEAMVYGYITVAEIAEIVNVDNVVDVVREAKIIEISAACNSAIVEGVDIQLGDETEHFNLSIEDQSNIANLFRVVELGGTEFPYQADGGKCRIYTAQEIAQIYITAQTAITTQTTYHNALKAYVQSLTNVDKIAAVTYGMALPKKYATEMNEKLSVAQAQMEAIVARLNG